MLSIKLLDLTDEGLLVVQNKTESRLLYKWTPELRDAIDAVLKLSRPVRGLHLFCARRSQPNTPDGFRSIWPRMMVKAVEKGLNRFTEHDLRAQVITDRWFKGQERRSGRELVFRLCEVFSMGQSVEAHLSFKSSTADLSTGRWRPAWQLCVMAVFFCYGNRMI